eukprot:2208019-Prymnesium_polylepis.2
MCTQPAPAAPWSVRAARTLDATLPASESSIECRRWVSRRYVHKIMRPSSPRLLLCMKRRAMREPSPWVPPRMQHRQLDFALDLGYGLGAEEAEPPSLQLQDERIQLQRSKGACITHAQFSPRPLAIGQGEPGSRVCDWR